MCIHIILIPTTKGKIHLISQRLSLNMPRLNQNQRVQALTMLARGDNVSNVRRAFGYHRNTVIQLRQRSSKQVGWQIAVDQVDRGLQTKVHYADAPSTSFSNGDKFCKAVRYQQTDSNAPPQGSPATHSAKEALFGTSAYSTSSGCPFAVGTTAFPMGVTAVGSDSILR